MVGVLTHLTPPASVESAERICPLVPAGVDTGVFAVALPLTIAPRAGNPVTGTAPTVADVSATDPVMPFTLTTAAGKSSLTQLPAVAGGSADRMKLSLVSLFKLYATLAFAQIKQL